MKQYTEKQKNNFKLQKKIILTYRTNLIEEMESHKCAANPKFEKCIDPRGIHCDTIDYMIDIVLFK